LGPAAAYPAEAGTEDRGVRGEPIGDDDRIRLACPVQGRGSERQSGDHRRAPLADSVEALSLLRALATAHDAFEQCGSVVRFVASPAAKPLTVRWKACLQPGIVSFLAESFIRPEPAYSVT